MKKILLTPHLIWSSVFSMITQSINYFYLGTEDMFEWISIYPSIVLEEWGMCIDSNTENFTNALLYKVIDENKAMLFKIKYAEQLTNSWFE